MSKVTARPKSIKKAKRPFRAPLRKVAPLREQDAYGYVVFYKPKGFSPRKISDRPRSLAKVKAKLDMRDSATSLGCATRYVESINRRSLKCGNRTWAAITFDRELAATKVKCESTPISTSRDLNIWTHRFYSGEHHGKLRLSASLHGPDVLYNDREPVALQALRSLRAELDRLEVKYLRRGRLRLADVTTPRRSVKGGAA